LSSWRAAASGFRRCLRFLDALIVATIVPIGLLGAPIAASATELTVPLKLDYLTLNAALKSQIYTGAGGRATFWQGSNSCQYLDGENPRFSREPGGTLALSTDATLALGLGIGGACVSPVTWSGIVKLDTVPYVAGLTLRLSVTDINLDEPDGTKSLLVGHGFDLIKGHIIPKLETFSFELEEPIRVLDDLFEQALPTDAAANLRTALATSHLEPQVVTESDGLKVTLAMALPEGFAPPPISASTAPLTPAEIAAWQAELDNWDAFLVFAIKQVGLTVVEKKVRDQLFALLMDSRYRLVQALASGQGAGGPDPVRLLFLSDWTQLRDIIKSAARRRGFGNRTLEFLSFISAGDALFAFDHAASALGVRISAGDLRRLARVMAPDVTADPLAFSFDEDPGLQQLFGISPPFDLPGALPDANTLPLPDLNAPASTPSPAPAPTSFLSAPMRLLNFAEALAMDSASTPPQLIILGRRLTPVVVDQDNAGRYRDNLAKLLSITAQREGDAAALNSSYHDLFRVMVKSVAWQESCWRQFVRAGSRVTYLESSTGDIGLMQVNKHIWRGFYSIPRLEWDIVYNASAGGDILVRLMQAAINRESSNRRDPAIAVVRSTYCAYNGGPAAYARWRTPTEPTHLRQIDDAFWDRFRVTAAGRSFDILQCAADWNHLH
jgi:Transglycosylase SLT domain